MNETFDKFGPVKRLCTESDLLDSTFYRFFVINFNRNKRSLIKPCECKGNNCDRISSWILEEIRQRIVTSVENRWLDHSITTKVDVHFHKTG